MVRFMGNGSGLKGILLAIFIGSARRVRSTAPFPSPRFFSKGSEFPERVHLHRRLVYDEDPYVPLRIPSPGGGFAVTRLLVDIPGIILIAWILARLLGEADRKDLLARAEAMTKD
jgi:hypothetical protein